MLISLLVLVMQNALLAQYLNAHIDRKSYSYQYMFMRYATSLVRLCASYAVLAFLCQNSLNTLFIFGAVIISLLWSAYESINIVSFRYFGISIIHVVRHLPIKPSDDTSASTAILYAKQYIPVKIFLTLIGFHIIPIMIILNSIQIHVAVFSMVFLCLFAAIARLLVRRETSSLVPSPVEAAFLNLDDKLTQKRLFRAERSQAVELCPSSRPITQNVFVIISESAGANINSSQNDGVSLSDCICKLSGNSEDWIKPARPITNSSCTDISIPTILTGCGGQESIIKLHEIPTLFDVAKSRSFTTMLYTSSSLKWANFDKFFGLKSIDKIYTADSENLTLINDLCADDYAVAVALGEEISRSEGPLFVVIYLNALHVPFQNVSACAIPEHIEKRRDRAAYVIEKSHQAIFQALKIANRYDDSCIISLGDHGETEGNNIMEESWRNSRLTKLSNSVVAPLMLIKPPVSLPQFKMDKLRENARYNVTTLDIAPTISSMLGVGLTNGLTYTGFDLCDFVPNDRILYTVTVNQWRSWPQSAVVIARGNDRIAIDYQNRHCLCSNLAGEPLKAELDALRDELLSAAISEPIVQKSISKIFRDKLGIKYNDQNASNAKFLRQNSLENVTHMQVGDEEYFYYKEDNSDSGNPCLQFHGSIDEKGNLNISSEQRDVVSYGPYIPLTAGLYRAVFSFDREFDFRGVRIDVLIDCQRIAAESNIEILDADFRAIMSFNLDQDADSVEVRLWNNKGSQGKCLGLRIHRT